MKRLVTLLCFFLFVFTYSQSLIQTIPLPSTSFWSYTYGMVYKDGNLWLSSYSSSAGNGFLNAIDLNGNVVSSLQINYPAIKESQGLASDGTNFWYVERKTARCDLFKVSPTGEVLDSIPTTPLFGTSVYLGGAAWDADGLWISVYYPDAKAALYKVDVSAKQIIDTIPVFGLQPTGITTRGDTLFYVMDGFQNDPENVYAVDLNTKDTLFSFHVPNPPGTRQDPRGLAWDGNNLWLLARPVGASSGRSLFKYDLGGGGNPSINLITKNIDFGNTQIDSTVSAYVYINNYGTTNLEIDSAFVSNGDFTLVEQLPIIIKPDSTKALTVNFKPTQNAVYNDSLLFYHNDPNFVYSKVSLKGMGIYTLPYMMLSPNAMDYGNKRITSTSYRTLTFTNKGSNKLVIDSLVLGTTDFYFLTQPVPITIDSIGSASVNIWFKADDYTVYSDTLKIYSNASNGGLKTVLLSAAGSPFDSTLGNIVWETQMPANPFTSFQEYAVKYIKNTCDLNGDKVDDIIAVTKNYFTLAFNGNSSGWGDILWSFNTAEDNNNTGTVERMQGLQIIDDIDGDGIKDVVIGTGGGNEFVYAISGATGLKIWEFGDSVNYMNGDISGLDVTRDWNSDGIPDILVSQSGNEYTGDGKFSVFLLNGETGEQIWRIDQSSIKKMKDAIAATDDGGAVGSRTAGATVAEVTGFDKLGNITWSFPTLRAVWGLIEIENIGGSSTSDLIAGDVGGNIYAISGDAGVQIWSRALANVFIEDLLIIPDINNSGTDDILVSALTSNAYLLEGSDGTTIWSSSVSGNILGIGILGDLNNDALHEVGIATLGNTAYVFESKAGTELFSYSFGSGGAGTAAECIWTMGDIDGNGSLEFASGSRDGRLIAFSGGTDVPNVVRNTELIPSYFELHQNYPNPFNPVTTIKYQLPVESKVSLKVFDVLGREVKTLINEFQPAGHFKLEWNGTDSFGNKVTSGIYFYRIETDNYNSVKKMLLLK